MTEVGDYSRTLELGNHKDEKKSATAKKTAAGQATHSFKTHFWRQ